MTPTPAAASLDLKEAAAFLGIHPATLQSLAASGAIPGAKVGGWEDLRMVERHYAHLAQQHLARYAANAVPWSYQEQPHSTATAA